MSELADLAADLRRAGDDVLDEGEKVVSKGALNIKTDWRDRWSGIAHAPMLPYTVTYDIHRGVGEVSAEVGPDKDLVVGGGPIRQPGRLGNIIEFGTVKNAPIPGGAPALDNEEPRFTRAAADLGERLLGRR